MSKLNNALHIVAAYLSNDARVKSYISILRGAGWHVDVISYEEDNLPAIEEHESLGIFRVSPKYQGDSVFKYLHSYGRFYRYAKTLAAQRHRELNYMIVHVHNMPNILIGIAASLKPRPGIILDMHDLMRINYETKFSSNALAVQAIKAEERWSISRADRIICADKGQKFLLKEFHPKVNSTVIMNLANPDIFKWEDHSWRTGVFRFVYHGTIAHRLGVDRVIEALRYLPENVVFRLIGDGDEKEKVLQLVKKFNLEHRVEVYPIVSVENLPAILRDCHAGIIPSRRTEATDSAMLPVKLLEYSALGIPSVVSDLRNIRLHFREDQVLFFEPESQQSMQEAMSGIVNSSEIRCDILRGLKEFNHENNWGSVSEIYLSIVGEISGSR